MKSKLDPEIYGSPESLITTELMEREIRSIMTVEEVIACDTHISLQLS